MSDDGPFAILHALPNPVLVIGPDERIALANSAAQELLGGDCQGWHHITALRQPSLLDAIEAAFAGAVASKARFLGTDGARQTTWDVTVAALNLAGRTHVVLSYENVTAVEEAGQMRRDFVANVSHELRTPLTAVNGFIETLRGPARDDAAARDRFLGMMNTEAGRMHRLIEDLLSLSRVEDQERVRPQAPVDIGGIVGSAVTSLSDQADGRGIVLDWTPPEAMPPIPGDADQLRQVVINLVENAIKYSRTDSTITIALSGPAPDPYLRGLGVRLDVVDQGEGIAPHHVGRLTERFYRVDTHRSRQIGGTGLGLAIVKHIVSRHRGRLRVQSEEGVGSRFSVLLPAKLPDDTGS